MKKLASTAVAGLVLILPAAAAADPGRANLNTATDAVYTPPKNIEVLGADPTGVASIPFAANQTVSDDGGGSVTSLPFTGLVALSVLGLGLVLLSGGALVRVVLRRSNPTG
jgi:hypothetical protein